MVEKKNLNSVHCCIRTMTADQIDEEFKQKLDLSDDEDEVEEGVPLVEGAKKKKKKKKSKGVLCMAWILSLMASKKGDTVFTSSGWAEQNLQE